ncbi:hypothetical protein CL634_11275 [bacterium]|nr:hypothetical protein [bacterium]|tara:strand:+ start:346 stop:990 length:645 start_codon:yes stop_codon:yes gene_type:complete
MKTERRISGGNEIVFKRYRSYEAYIAHQKSKVPRGSLLHQSLSKGGTSWEPDCAGFRTIFKSNKDLVSLISTFKNALCLGARTGQEVFVLQELGIKNAVGIDLNDDPPLVVEGDVHSLQFDDSSFDFVFSNIFDHVLYPDKFISEIERVVRPNGYCLLHVDGSKSMDEYSANQLYDVRYPITLFKKDIDIIKEGKLKLDFQWPDFTEFLIKIKE